jgi:ribose transport system ATP-binding protein
MTQPLLSASGISKAYPGVQALQNVSLSIPPGKVIAIVGENGAGKTTLMKIIAGVERPDAGTLCWNGENIHLSGVQAAEKLGIVLIHQELNLAHNLDIAASIFLGREKTWGGPLRLLRRDIYPQAEALLKTVGLHQSPATRVGSLSVGQQQLVEIARALSLKSKLLIMDEPTSSLTETETQTLYGVIENLKAQGVSILYISHRLKEIEQLADHAVVLRDGRNSGELTKEEIKPDALIKLMVGRDIKQQARITTSTTSGKTVLEVSGLRWSPTQDAAGVSCKVHAGEIVGVAGLVGAGRTELAETLFGIRPRLSGSIKLEGADYRPTNPRAALQAGIFLVPEDRRHQGLVLSESIRNNISMATLYLRQALGLIYRQRENDVSQQQVKQLAIKTPSILQTVGLLSGGNQQKVVLAKGLVKQPVLFILDEPTRGVDVGAKAEIYSIMRELTAQGVGIMMISSDLEEVLGISDRVIVLHESSVAGELSRDEVSEEAIMHLATGQAERRRAS